MSIGRGTAVAIALAVGAVAAAGCGLGPGAGREDVSLTVTREFGAERMLARQVDDVTESDTVMRVLERNAELATRYGGGFVQSIDGVAGGQRGERSFDWFFYVNGVESPVGAAEVPLRGGEAIWWDYRDWSATLSVPAVVGSWPQPFRDGYEGRRHPVAVECRGGGAACGEVRSRLKGVGAPLAGGSPQGAIRVLVGPWARLREDPAAAQLERGPSFSGVFADFARRRGGGLVLEGLDPGGRPARAFGPSAGLVAATRRGEAPPVWLVTGATAAGARAAASLLDGASLRDHYAVVTEAGRQTPLPLPAR